MGNKTSLGGVSWVDVHRWREKKVSAAYDRGGVRNRAPSVIAAPRRRMAAGYGRHSRSRPAYIAQHWAIKRAKKNKKEKIKMRIIFKFCLTRTGRAFNVRRVARGA